MIIRFHHTLYMFKNIGSCLNPLYSKNKKGPFLYFTVHDSQDTLRGDLKIELRAQGLRAQKKNNRNG